MFTATVLREPLAGKEAELQQLLEETVRHLQSTGLRVALFSRLFRAEGPMFVTLTALDALTDGSVLGEKLRADATYQRLLARINPLLSRAAGTALSQRLVTGSRLTDAQFLRTSRFVPAHGQARELRGVLEEYVRQRAADGVSGVNLAAHPFGSDGYTLYIHTACRSLADIEAFVTEPPPLAVALGARTMPLRQGPILSTVARILIPLPA